ncbi:hypothetical protein M8C21_010336, partial [Ambrosia artemisiifolia]
ICGYNIPLVADIHFAPSIALRVAKCFDKICVNPGNFVDRRAQFERLEYTDNDYKKDEHIEKVKLLINLLPFHIRDLSLLCYQHESL